MIRPRILYKSFWVGLWKYLFGKYAILIWKADKELWLSVSVRISDRDRTNLLGAVYDHCHGQEQTLKNFKQILDDATDDHN